MFLYISQSSLHMHTFSLFWAWSAISIKTFSEGDLEYPLYFTSLPFWKTNVEVFHFIASLFKRRDYRIEANNKQNILRYCGNTHKVYKGSSQMGSQCLEGEVNTGSSSQPGSYLQLTLTWKGKKKIVFSMKSHWIY